MVQHGRVVAEVEAERQAALDPDHVFGAKADQPLRTGEGSDLLAFPNDLGRTGHVDEVARLEVDEQKSGLRVEQDVAHCVEVIVAGKIGEHEGPVVLDADEARLAASMRDVGALGGHAWIFGVGGGDEQGVGAFDQGAALDGRSGRSG